jgi:beta-aspartyl-peptidase (threonine type)
MNRALALLFVFVGLTITTFGQAGSHAEKDIRAVLELQQSAWNRGDVDGFMAYYWKSDELTFQSGNTRMHGWNDVLSRYKKTYPPDRMGQLEFTDLTIHVLSRDSAFVLGRFRLDQSGSLKEGLFTLIFRRMPEGWRIVHDHTSSKQ